MWIDIAIKIVSAILGLLLSIFTMRKAREYMNDDY